MKLSDFNFELPNERIARFPSDKRVDSKLMVVNRSTGEIDHHKFSDVPDIISEKDFIVLNNTEVDPVRLFAFSGDKMFEILIIKKISENVVEVFAMPAKKLHVGVQIEIGEEITGVVESIGDRGRRTIRFNCSVDLVLKNGFAPLPPYIKRKYDEAARHRIFDLDRYQTVYSKNPGSIAAPTAGLHFDKRILKIIEEKNEILELTLHVGPATFQKIEVEDINNHRMGKENIVITKSVSERIDSLISSGMNLVAVGTTSVRSLETFALIDPVEERFISDLFISPGFRFKMVDKLITNFHLPESSLFILVSAFAGLDLMKKAYLKAIENKYNFFSYGDAMLII